MQLYEYEYVESSIFYREKCMLVRKTYDFIKENSLLKQYKKSFFMNLFFIFLLHICMPYSFRKFQDFQRM